MIRTLADKDIVTVPVLANLAGVPMPIGTLKSKQKKKLHSDIMSWVRHNNLPLIDADDPTEVRLSNLAGIPRPWLNPTPKEKQRAVEQAVEWITKHSPTPAEFDDPTLVALASLTGTTGSIEILCRQPSTAEKTKAGENALHGIRRNDNVDNIDDPTLVALGNVT
jgi:hypothetical protein